MLVGAPAVGSAQLVRFSNLSKKVGFTDTDGNPLIEPRYDSVKSFFGGAYFVWLNGKCGLLSAKGNPVFPCTYDACRASKSGHIEVTLAGKRGVVDAKGTVIVPAKFDAVEIFDNKTIEVRLVMPSGAKIGLWSWSGKELLAAEYDNITFPGVRRAKGTKGTRTVVVDM